MYDVIYFSIELMEAIKENNQLLIYNACRIIENVVMRIEAIKAKQKQVKSNIAVFTWYQNSISWHRRSIVILENQIIELTKKNLTI